MELIYGTGNPAKLKFMRREIRGLPIELISLGQAAERDGVALADVEESGRDPLENARIKACAYYRLFRKPVFSCDSGLYLWDYQTGEMLPEEVQPGIHVRRQPEGGMQEQEGTWREAAYGRRADCSFYRSGSNVRDDSGQIQKRNLSDHGGRTQI